MKKMSHERVMQILKEHGTIVMLDEAKIILDFMNMLASISIEIYLKNESENINKMAEEPPCILK